MRKYQFPEDQDVAGDIRARYGYSGPLLDIFVGNKGAGVHKWHHYIPIYDMYFARRRGTALRFLEIGVNKGGSLQVWREYFGKDATIFGIDINPECAEFDDQAGQVRIGSQDDPEFLNKVVDEMGGIDVVLDDGSHQMRHIKKSLQVLFPRLETGGTYMIEDLHTAYMPKFGGGLDERGNFFNSARRIIDDMHRWYHNKPIRHLATAGEVSGLHVHDSIVVLDKAAVTAPTHSRIS